MTLQKLHVLTRAVSPYSGPTQILGVFESRAAAEDAKRTYIEALEKGARPDPWAEQAYQKVDLTKDVRVDSGWEVDLSPGGRAFIVTSWSDHMGQVIRTVIAVKGLRADAEKAARVHEAASESSMVEDSRDIIEATPGTLLHDDQRDPAEPA